jgi:hypothetical protein
MKKWMEVLMGAAGLLILAPALHAQAAPSGFYRSHIQAGIGGMYLNNDYTDKGNKGLSIWGDYDFTHLIGVEVEAHFGGIITPDDIGENSYLVGPRIMYHRRKATVYGKIMLGRGTITNQLYNQSSSYNIIPAYGGGLEYRVRHFNIRVVDVELQKWPDFEPNTLSPLAITVGLSYVIR